MKKTNLSDRIHDASCDCKKCCQSCENLCKNSCEGLWGIKSHFSFNPENLNNAIKIAATFAFGILTLFLLAKTVNEVKSYEFIGQNPNGIQNSITVSGKAELMAKPDITKISVTVSEEGKTYDEAQSKMAVKSNQVIALAKSKGVSEKDIKTVTYYTNPKYASKTVRCDAPVSAKTSAVSSASAVTKGKALKVQAVFKADGANVTTTNTAPASAPKAVAMPSVGSGVSGSAGTAEIAPCITNSSEIIGYEATITLEVKVRNIAKNPALASGLVQEFAKVGAKIGDLQNTYDDLAKIKDSIRAEAIYNARKEAYSLAESLGVRLGKVISFSENNYPYAYGLGDVRAMSSEKAVSVAPELPVGENKITSEVSVTYSIR